MRLRKQVRYNNGETTDDEEYAWDNWDGVSKVETRWIFTTNWKEI